jgi:transcriptional regulator with XRE-family HTH domain
MSNQTTQILEMSKTMKQVDIANKLKIAVSTVSNTVTDNRRYILELQNNLKAEHIELDTDIAFELSNLTKDSFDKEKAQSDLLDEFSEAYGIVLTTVNDSYENKSEFLDFLKTKAYELY